MGNLKNGLNRTKEGYFCGEYSLEGIIDKFGTPLYLYHGNTIRERIKEIRRSIPYDGLELFFAMKANNNPHLLSLLKSEGVNIDAVSIGEIIMARKCGFSPDRIMYTANHITDGEMDAAASQGVVVNIGSLSRLKKWGRANPGTSVCIRFNPDVVAGEFTQIQTGGDKTKFGILLSQSGDVVNMAREFNLKIVGLHKHTGSGIADQDLFLQAMKNLLSVADKEDFPDLQFVDFGGGFKVPYLEEERPIDYATFGRRITQLFSEFCHSYGRSLKLYFEPGKYLLSEAGVYVVEVNTLKNNGGLRIAGTNGGFPQLLRPTYYGAEHTILNLTNPDGKAVEYDIAGNICESGDLFATNRGLPEIREGDVLGILNAGAYGYSMGGTYNLRPLPPEVLVDNSLSLIRKGLSSEELVQRIGEDSQWQ